MAGTAGLTRSAMLVTEGSNSCISSSRFGATSWFRLVTPVTLPPGRFRLATSPTSTGSAPVAKTIGISRVAAFAATAEAMPPAATSTVTRSRTKPAASSGSRPVRASAHRYSILTFWPKQLGGLEIDDELEIGGSLNRQIGRFGTFQYLVYVAGSTSIQVRIVWSLGH